MESTASPDDSLTFLSLDKSVSNAVLQQQLKLIPYTTGCGLDLERSAKPDLCHDIIFLNGASVYLRSSGSWK